MPTQETTYKWAAILFLFSTAMWIAQGVTIDHIALAIAHLVVGIRFLTLWRRLSRSQHREEAKSPLLLGPSFLLTPGFVLGLAVAAAINAVALPLIRLWLERS
ncbi:MAG: hypothetical protein WBL61_03645 [Bryobacteraceae bacterium]